MASNFITAVSGGVILFGGLFALILFFALIHGAVTFMQDTVGPWGGVLVCFIVVVMSIFVLLNMCDVRSREESYITNITVTKIGDQYSVTDNETGEPIEYTSVRYISNERLKEPRIKEIKALNNSDKVVASVFVLEIPVEEERITGADEPPTNETSTSEPTS